MEQLEIDTSVYECSGNTGYHDFNYQQDLAFVLFVRSSLAGRSFKLATDMVAADQFDDVVLFVDHPKEAWLFQAKYSAVAKHVSCKQLFPEDVRLRGKGFELYKYLESYIQTERYLKIDGRQNKYFIFSNSSLEENEELKQWVDIVPREVHSVMDFSKFGGRYVGFKPKEEKITTIREIINRDFFALKISIIALFSNGQVTQPLFENRSHLSNILKVTGNRLKFHDTFSANSMDASEACLFKELQTHFQNQKIDMKTIRIELNKSIKELYRGRSRTMQLPPFVDDTIVKEFFDRLILCINQPNNLRTIIDEDLQLWMKSCVKPDELEKFDEFRWMLVRFNFYEVFRNWNEQNMSNVGKTFQYKKLLSDLEGGKCIQNIDKKPKKYTSKQLEVPERYENTVYRGNTYKHDLAFVLFVRSSLARRSFKLATDMVAADKFDEVVMFVEHPKEVWLFQVKHSAIAKRVSCKELFPENGRLKGYGFNLFKCIRSCFLVEQNLKTDGQQNKYFIFSNKSLEENDELKEWVDIEDREVDSLMNFSKHGASYKSFMPKKDKINIIRNHVNRDFLTLKEVIIALFEDGIIEKQKLCDYKSYLSNILEITGNCLKFRNTFLANRDGATQECLYKELQTHFLEKKHDMKTIRKQLDKEIGNTLKGKPDKRKQLPPFVDDILVKEFFDRLTLCFNQPRKLRSIIEYDLKLWMKSCAKPDELGKFGEFQRMSLIFNFDEVFRKWNEQNMLNVGKKCQDKTFISDREGKKCIQDIEEELKMQLEVPELYENTVYHGNTYKHDLAFVLFVRSSLARRSFKLATDMVTADKFDEVVMFVEHPKEAWLFQVKHSVIAKRVSCKELFPENVCLKGYGFNLFKCIRSCFLVEQNFKTDDQQNKYFIFSNKSLEENDELKEWVDIKDKEVDSLMNFSRHGASYKSFMPKKDKIDIIRNHVNRDFLTLREVIIALFEDGIIEKQTLCDYKAYLSNILEITGNCLKFRNAFLTNSDDATQACLYKELQTHFQEKKQDMKSIRKELDKSIGNTLKGKPDKRKQLPPFVDDILVKEFFDRLTLCFNQPSELKTIIDEDLHLWIKSYLRPDELGMFEECHSMLPRVKFDEVFRKWNKQNILSVGNECKDNRFLSYSEGEKCIQDIEKVLKKQLEALERDGKKYKHDLAYVLFVRSSLEGCKFQLATANVGFGKFDDVTLLVEDLQEAWLFDVKHSSIAKHVSCKELFPKDARLKGNDFDLYKYIRSYVFVERNMATYGLQNKYFIFSNKSLEENDELQQWVDIFPREVDPLMDFSKHGASYVGFMPKEDKIDMIRDIVNGEFSTLKKVIIDLFKDEIIETQILHDYSAYLSNILEVTSNCLKFRDTFSVNSDDDAKRRLYKALQKNFPKKIQEMKIIREDLCEDLDKVIGNILKENPEQVQLPPLVNDTIVKEFFDRLTLCINQPSDLKTIDDLRLWMKSFVRPDDLGRFSESQSMLPRVKFDEVFEKWYESNKSNDDNKLLKNMFISNREGEKCMQDIKNELIKNVSEQLDVFERYYITRTFSKGDNWYGWDVDFAKDLQENFDDNKCSIIIAEPGMGKTTVLQYIGFEVQKRFKRDVVLTYFEDLYTKLDKVANNDIKSMIPHIFQDVLSETNLHILQSNPNRILLLFDGFDEIAASQSSKAIALIKEFQNSSNAQIIVTGRIHVQEILEQELNVKPMRLEQLTYYEKMKFLRLFWKIPIDQDTNNYCERKHKKFETFSSLLLKSFNFDLTGVPAVMRRLAEVYSKCFDKYLESDSDDPSETISNEFSAVKLYAELVEKSFFMKIKSQEEMKLSFQQYVFEHQLIAIKQLAIEKLKSVIDEENYSQLIERLLQRLKNGSDKSLLLNFTSVDDPVEFVHRSCAEYFVATYIFEDVEKYSKVLFQIIEHHNIVRKFFFMLVEKNSARRFSYLAILDNICTEHSEMAFWACEESCVKVVKKILANRNFRKEVHNNHGSLLHVAVKVGCIELVSYLLDQHHIDANMYSVNRKTPLHVATSYGKVEIVKMLIKNSATIEAQDKDGNTSLHLAAYCDELEICKILLDNNANIEAQDKDGKTPLHISAGLNHSRIVEMLIDRSANIEAQDNDGKTPLHIAVDFNHATIVKMLIDNSANIETRDKAGKTPLLLAAFNNNMEIVRMLMDEVS